MIKTFNQFLHENPFVKDLDSGRAVSLFVFKNMIEKHLKFSKDLKIAIISGSIREPELNFIGRNDLKIDVFSFEENKIFDLDLDWSTNKYEKYKGIYDLVLVNHVLEHVPNIHTAFKNLHILLKYSGLLYISVPGISNIHSDPFYFYSGFHPRTLNYYAKTVQLEILESDGFFSKKISQMHSINDWKPVRYSIGLFSSISHLRYKFFMKDLKWLVLDFLSYPFSSFFEINKEKYLVTSWVLLKKPE